MNLWTEQGSFQRELDRLDMGDRIPAYSSFAVSDEACPLLKVRRGSRWFVDSIRWEGQEKIPQSSLLSGYGESSMGHVLTGLTGTKGLAL
jgi:hypothetical protein